MYIINILDWLVSVSEHIVSGQKSLSPVTLCYVSVSLSHLMSTDVWLTEVSEISFLLYILYFSMKLLWRVAQCYSFLFPLQLRLKKSSDPRWLSLVFIIQCDAFLGFYRSLWCISWFLLFSVMHFLYSKRYVDISQCGQTNRPFKARAGDSILWYL